MSLFGRNPEPDSVKLGRTHGVNAEIHYSSGAEHWWYHGLLWLTETRPVREREFNPVLQDPRNQKIVEALKTRGRSIEEVARVCEVPVWVARDVARALESAGAPHVLRVYGLETARKEEERVLVTIDQDLIHEAPMIPYTKTEKGAKRLQWAMMVAMVIVDAIFVFAMLQVVSVGPSLAYDTSAVQSITVQFGEIIAFPTAILAVYVIMARRTQVLDMELQPVIESLQDTHTEAVYLVNSEKTPASVYVARILKLDPGVIRELTEEIVRFASDTIANLMQHQTSLRTQLDAAKDFGIERFSLNADMNVLGRATGSGGGGAAWTTTVLIAILVTIAAVVGTYAAVAGGL